MAGIRAALDAFRQAQTAAVLEQSGSPRLLKLSRVGIVGAGQLGRMLALAGYPLGIRCCFSTAAPRAPGAQVAPILIGELEDAALLAALAARSDVITFDWENISGKRARAPGEADAGSSAAGGAGSVAGPAVGEGAVLQAARFRSRRTRRSTRKEQLAAAARKVGLPGILKTRRMGYDGKGQFVVRGSRDIDAAWSAIGGAGLIYEKFQDFSREVSIVGARSAAGQIGVLSALRQLPTAAGILRYSIAPFVNTALERYARIYLKRVMNALCLRRRAHDRVLRGRGPLIANEMAPRVHNSGHWTIEGCVTSQFENHLRAICDLPLGSTRALGHTAMINFLGTNARPRAPAGH